MPLLLRGDFLFGGPTFINFSISLIPSLCPTRAMPPKKGSQHAAAASSAAGGGSSGPTSAAERTRLSELHLLLATHLQQRNYGTHDTHTQSEIGTARSWQAQWIAAESTPAAILPPATEHSELLLTIRFCE